MMVLTPLTLEQAEAWERTKHSACPFCACNYRLSNPQYSQPRDGLLRVTTLCGLCGYCWADLYTYTLSINAQTCPQCQQEIVAGAEEVVLHALLYSSTDVMTHARCADAYERGQYRPLIC